MKRLMDLLVALVALLLLSPLLLGIALVVRRNLGAPVLFRQTRPGHHGRPFQMIKFRTMRDGEDAQGRPLPDAERLTPFGEKLRATSLDELPELWNVLKGDMSLVGPRPSRCDRLGPGQRSQRLELGGEVRPRRMVRRSPHAVAGPEDTGHDRRQGRRPGGHRPRRRGGHAPFPGVAA